MNESEIAAAIAALSAVFPSLGVSFEVFGANIHLTLAELSSVLNGQAVSIPVQPLVIAAAGKNIEVSLGANAVSLAVK